MTALRSLRRPLTIADYLALPEDQDERWELQEGVLVMTPSATPFHGIAMGALFGQLRRQCGPQWAAGQDSDVDLQLDDTAATVRCPDVFVVRREALDRLRVERGVLRASDVVLAVEIISPGSRRMDRMIKRAEYADAGIEHYWIVDLDAPVSMIVCRREGDGYVDDGERTGVVELVEPFPLRIELDALL